MGHARTAAEDVSDLAIRQPAVIRLLERGLWADDGDAFAVGLELACRWFAEVQPAGHLPRLGHRVLDAATLAVARGYHDRAVEAWITAQLTTVRAVLDADDRQRIGAVLQALAWAGEDVGRPSMVAANTNTGDNVGVVTA